MINDVDVELARPVVAELQKGGARVLSVAADVTRRTDVEAMMNHVVGEFGRLDVLVNNAGINRDAMSHKMTEEQWDQILTVNLKAFVPEPGVAVDYVRPEAISELIREGSFSQLHHIAAWFLADPGSDLRC